MSTVDASIIKTLMDHIGVNPDGGDSVTIGHIATKYVPHPFRGDALKFSVSGTQWTASDDFDDSVCVPGKTIWCLKRKDDETIDTYLCYKCWIKNFGAGVGQFSYSFAKIVDGDYNVGVNNEESLETLEVVYKWSTDHWAISCKLTTGSIVDTYVLPKDVNAFDAAYEKLGFFTIQFSDQSHVTNILLNSLEANYIHLRKMMGMLAYIMREANIEAGDVY